MSEQTLSSGEPGSTGREVFEHSTATGPGPGYGRDAGESATTGFEGSTGIGAGGHEHHHHDTSGGPPAKTGSAGHDLIGGTAGAGGRETEGVDPHETGAFLPGTTGTGGGVPPPQSGEYANEGEPRAHHHHHHHHHHREGEGGATGAGIGASEQSQIGDSYGANSSGMGAGGPTDRVGNLNQQGALYERTGDQGPATTGAAGTDRFDSDRSGVTGNSYGAQDAYPDLNETTTRAEGKSSGGLMGVLGTSDKDFTGRDRLGGASGAYADTDGRFQNNTTGPGGNTALTGREGNIENNPVAQSQSNTGTGGASSTGSGVTKGEQLAEGEGNEHKAGFVQKLKELF